MLFWIKSSKSILGHDSNDGESLLIDNVICCCYHACKKNGQDGYCCDMGDKVICVDSELITNIDATRVQ